MAVECVLSACYEKRSLTSVPPWAVGEIGVSKAEWKSPVRIHAGTENQQKVGQCLSVQ